jgi:ferredoxin
VITAERNATETTGDALPKQPGDARATRARRSAPFDVLRLPLIGPFLRWRYSRIALQVPLLLIAAVMVWHAFWGPQLAPKNLAALLTWVHFRGLVVLVILLAGNLFCMACPFVLPRELARKFFSPRWRWPRQLRNKWPAIVLFVGVLFAYELFDLWGEPRWTGALVVGYFAAALVVDALFREASFCKYVCPVGQFNFLAATLSPLEVAVRDKSICADCHTKDCIRGVRAGHAEPPSPGTTASTTTPHALPIIQRGCELALFQPRKVDNLDCTFCLDCVYACPHDNVGILARLPAEKLGFSGTRSGIGSVERRFDFTALITVFTFGALLNAFAMISPVYALEQWIAAATGLTVEWPILAALFVAALVLEPAILLAAAAWLSRRQTGRREPLLTVVNRFARSLVPIGFGVWLAHYGFHFFTGVLTVVPVTQDAVWRAWGAPLLGMPLWRLGGLPDYFVDPLEIGFMSLGLVGSWLVAWAIARQVDPRRAGRIAAPWMALHAMLYVAGMWIMQQPMDMRGTMIGG